MCIAMEHASGGDLAAKIQRQRARRTLFTNKRITVWFQQMSKAIQYCHSHNILHRDLKPGNIFLAKDGTIKIGDFGIAVQLNSTGSFAKTCIGTPTYMAPEVIREEPYSKPADVWSLGCVLYEMCTLKPAFMGRNMRLLVLKIVRGNKKPLHHSSAFKKIVDAMICVKQNQRARLPNILQMNMFNSGGNVKKNSNSSSTKNSHNHRQAGAKPTRLSARLQNVAKQRPRLRQKPRRVHHPSKVVAAHGVAPVASRPVAPAAYKDPLAVFNAGWANRREEILKIAGIRRPVEQKEGAGKGASKGQSKGQSKGAGKVAKKTPQKAMQASPPPAAPQSRAHVPFAPKWPERVAGAAPTPNVQPVNVDLHKRNLPDRQRNKKKHQKREVMHAKGLNELRALYLAKQKQKQEQPNNRNRPTSSAVPTPASSVVSPVPPPSPPPPPLPSPTPNNGLNNANKDVSKLVSRVVNNYNNIMKEKTKSSSILSQKESRRASRDLARKKMRQEIAKKKRQQKKRRKQEVANGLTNPSVVFVQKQFAHCLDGGVPRRRHSEENKNNTNDIVYMHVAQDVLDVTKVAVDAQEQVNKVNGLLSPHAKVPEQVVEDHRAMDKEAPKTIPKGELGEKVRKQEDVQQDEVQHEEAEKEKAEKEEVQQDEAEEEKVQQEEVQQKELLDEDVQHDKRAEDFDDFDVGEIRIEYVSDSEEEEDEDAFHTSQLPAWPIEYGTGDHLRHTNGNNLSILSTTLSSDVGRIEGLRQYLEKQLGDECLIDAHRFLLEHSVPLSEENRDALRALLEKGTGDIVHGEGDVEHPSDLIPLLRRIIVLEATMF